MQPLVTIDIAKEAMNFSAGHFTIFSATARENLHGHNFRLGARVTAPVSADGLCFDYAILKRAMRELCAEHDEITLLPAHSPYLRVERTATEVLARYGEETLRFLHRDVRVLPVANVTVEALSAYFLGRLRGSAQLAEQPLVALAVRVSSGDGQWGESRWDASTAA